MKPAIEEASVTALVPGDRLLRETLLSDLLELTKARLTSLVLVTTFVGFCLGSLEEVNWIVLGHCLLGTALVAGGAAVFNQWLETGPDACMTRTRSRPLPSGRISGRFALGFGAALSICGLIWLWWGTRPQAAGLVALTWIVYVAAYTPMKRFSSACTLVGAVSGALPPVIGYAAAGGRMDPVAGFLFALLFLWQMPHFVAVNWLHREEYERAGFCMWSNGDSGGRRSAGIAVGFALALLVLTVGFAPAGFFGPLYVPVAGLLGLGWSVAAGCWYHRPTRGRGRTVFLLSLLYLPLVLGLMLLARA